jgi:AcrR family transcriptional regulator
MAAMTAGVSVSEGGARAALGGRAAKPGTPGGPWLYGRWAQVPAQKRSERSFLRFLDAAEGLLDDRHWYELSVQDIVRGAKASVGSFYNRFADKAALLHCLDDRLGEELEQTLRGLVLELEATPTLVPDAPGIVISLMMRLCEGRRGVIRALDLAHKMTPEDGPGRLGARFDMALERLADFLVATDPALMGRSRDTVVRAFRESFSLARERLVYGEGKGQYGRTVTGGDALHGMLLAHYRASVGAAD